MIRILNPCPQLNLEIWWWSWNGSSKMKRKVMIKWELAANVFLFRAIFPAKTLKFVDHCSKVFSRLMVPKFLTSAPMVKFRKQSLQVQAPQAKNFYQPMNKKCLIRLHVQPQNRCQMSSWNVKQNLKMGLRYLLMKSKEDL